MTVQKLEKTRTRNLATRSSAFFGRIDYEENCNDVCCFSFSFHTVRVFIMTYIKKNEVLVLLIMSKICCVYGTEDEKIKEN